MRKLEILALLYMPKPAVSVTANLCSLITDLTFGQDLAAVADLADLADVFLGGRLVTLNHLVESLRNSTEL